MTTRHAYISTFEAAPGMHLARLLRNHTHQRLFQLPTGTELTDELIRQITLRGIQCLVVEERDDREDQDIERDRLQIEQETNAVFRNANLARPAIARLYDAVLQYRAEHEA
jgi:hypothetical protein